MKRCWQIRIRQEQVKSDGQWRLACGDCQALATGTSCWELETPSCCAPLYVTCDFCCLYIEHRREIASLAQEGHAEDT